MLPMPGTSAPVDLGFDPDLAIAALLSWQIQNDHDTGRVWSELRRSYLLGGQRERDSVIFRLRATHLQQHGAVSSDSCKQSPCKREAVCLAVGEIFWYRLGQASDVLAVAAGLLRINGVLAQLDDDFLRDLGVSAKRLEQARAETARHFRVKPAPWEMSKTVAALLRLIRRSAAPAAEAASQFITSEPAKAQLRPTRRGRRGYPLLHAVWQTLAQGGFTPTEIAELVPDDFKSGDAFLIDRIRKALPREDQGTFGLWSVPPGESPQETESEETPPPKGRRRK